MIIRNRFDIFKIHGKLGKIRDWMKSHNFPPKILFFIMGILSTAWFLVRVIPKPSRASYPCMQVAAPLMSGFVVYLLSLGGITLALRKAKQNILRARYIAAGSFILAALVGLVIALTHGIQNSYSNSLPGSSGPDDGPNQPIGKPLGINPGRVVWIWNPEATNENCTTNFESQDWYFKPENTNRQIVSKMVSESILKLCEKTTLSESWDLLFRYQNIKKYNKDKGFSKGEKIFIKINQGASKWLLTQEDKNNGYYFPKVLKPDDEGRGTSMAPTETGPYLVLELLRQLVNESGINQADIAVGDPMSDIYGHNYDVWFAEFPGVKYIDRFSTMHGRTLIFPTSADLLFYSDKKQSDKLFDIIENADYMINVASLKPHVSAGISLTAKNHFGSQASPRAIHLHYSLMEPRRGIATNGGYHKYRVLVDLMGSKYLGQNTVLYVVDGLFGGGASETKPPVKYFMSPFNNDWCNSIYLSQDQVALESVCYDFLRTEWNGINKHDQSNNSPENGPAMNGVDDYLHQAADSANWPAGIIYDPDRSGKPLPGLGIHEHWNNPEEKQYSCNLGRSWGIDLISIPDTLVKNEVAPGKSKLTVLPFDQGINAKTFLASVVDDDNVKWFITEEGIISYDGGKWILHNKNRKVSTKDLRDFAYEASTYGPELWIASPMGATVASLPIDARTGATTYHTENAIILSNDVRSIAIGKGSMRWIGTDKGVSAFMNKKWLENSYKETYPEDLFRENPITSMATNPRGDTLYIGTEGAGVARVFRNDVDAVSGASEYSIWGPILMPSNNIYSMLITSDGTQWFGTDRGIARHTGNKTLEKWTIFSTKNGLVNDSVQAIAADKNGKIWFGTKGGVSVFDGSLWTSYTENDGLNSNNVLSISVDREGMVWLGTDNGVNRYYNGEFISYK